MLNPITYTEDVVRDFLRYQLTTYPFADERLHEQMRRLLSLEETRRSPLLRGPYVSLSRAFRQGASVADLVSEGVLHPHMTNLIPYPHVYGHQETAIRAVCGRRPTLVSTGTGSGKTETFLYPIISHCLELRDQNAPPSITAVLIYPMNALAEDQLDRLRELLVGSGVTFGMYVGKTPERRADVVGTRLPAGTTRGAYEALLAQSRGKNAALHPDEERASREEIRQSPPRILLTNVKQLELLLTRQRDVQMFQNARLEYLVFDEAHTFSGANGAETACLIRRLRAFCGKTPSDTVCIGTSATIADTERGVEAGRDFAARFFGVDGESVKLVGEEYEEEVWAENRSASPPLPGDPPSKALQYVLEALSDVDVERPGQQELDSFRKTFELLTGATLGRGQDWREVLYDWLSRNEVVFQINEVLKRGARPLFELPETLAATLGRTVPAEEVLTWLSLGAAARKAGRPLLRPVVHGFIRGIQGAVVTFSEVDRPPQLWLSHEEATAETEELHRFELLTCTTCGQHYFGHQLLDFELVGNTPGGGNADGDSHFWDPAKEGEDADRVVLVDRLIFDESDEDERNALNDSKRAVPLHLCRFCGTAHPTPGARCVGCGRQDARVPLYAVRSKEGREGSLTSCLACGSSGRRRHGRYREPARAVKATNVADVHVLAQSMLEHAERKRLLIFADNRQDAAFQAGWMQDHARRFRLRSLLYDVVARNGELSVGDLVHMLDDELDADDNLSRTLLPEVWREVRKAKAGLKHAEARKKFLRFQVFREITIGPRQRLGLEPWGRIRIDYVGLDPAQPFFQTWAAEIGCEPEELYHGVCTLLDQHRRTGLIYDREHEMYTRLWSDGDREIQRGYLPQLLLFGFPKGLKLERDSDDNKARITQWVSSSGLTTARGVARKWGVEDERAASFLRELWEVVTAAGVLTPVTLMGPRKPLTHVDGAHQIDGDVIQIVAPETHGVYRCALCRKSYTRPSPKNACIAYRCNGTLSWEAEQSDDYDLLLLDQRFQMVRPAEHSAQIPAPAREMLERAFKGDSEFVNTLVCTPTLELGVDIGALDSVLMRNVPPSPANYWQRAGRAGRRHRMAVNFTYARPASHDRAYFRDPLLMLDGLIRPPRFNLKNELMVRKHAHATILSTLHRMARDEALAEEVEPIGLSSLSEASTSSEEKVEIREALGHAFPDYVSGYLYQSTGEVRRERFVAAPLAKVLKKHEALLLNELRAVFAQGWPAADAELVALEQLRAYIREMVECLEEVVERLYRRRDWAIAQITRLHTVFERQGVLNPEQESTRRRCNALLLKLKGAKMRSRVDAEGVDDTYTFSVLAAEGFLPGYGLDTGTVLATYQASDGGDATRDWAIRRGTALALREYVPGALIYAGGNKYFPRKYQMAAEDAAMFTVDPSSQAVQEVGTPSPQALATLGSAGLVAYPICDVELPHQSNISDDEDYRFQLSSAVFGYEQNYHRGGGAYSWGSRDVQLRRSVHMRLVNVGPLTHVDQQELGYPVCTVCGDSRSPYASERELDNFQEKHAEWCGKPPQRIGFYADVVADALKLCACKNREEAFSIAEALRNGAALTLQMELGDLQVMVVGQVGQELVDVLLYDPMPGGSGLLDQMLERWDEVVSTALNFVDQCPARCDGACSECLMDYRNSFYHRFLDRRVARDLLRTLGGAIDEVHPIPPEMPGTKDPGPGATNDAEARLEAIFQKAGFTNFETQKEIKLGRPLGSTRPDFYFEDPNDMFEGICVYLDGLSAHIHGNPETAQRDAEIRTELRNLNYDVHAIPASHLYDKTSVGNFLFRLGTRLVGKTKAKALREQFDDLVPDSNPMGDERSHAEQSAWDELLDLVDDRWREVLRTLRDENLPVPLDVHSELMVDGLTSNHEAIAVWQLPLRRVALVETEVVGATDDVIVVVGGEAWLEQLRRLLVGRA